MSSNFLLRFSESSNVKGEPTSISNKLARSQHYLQHRLFQTLYNFAFNYYCREQGYFREQHVTNRRSSKKWRYDYTSRQENNSFEPLPNCAYTFN